MASGYTNHLRLPLWEGSDPVLRTEFNETHEKLEAAVTGRPVCAVGSYVGNGAGGSDNPSVLTFDFTPQLLILVQDHGTNYTAGTVLIRGQSKSAGMGIMESNHGCNISVVWEDNAVRWSAGLAESQFNREGSVYRYMAFGMA